MTSSSGSFKSGSLNRVGFAIKASIDERGEDEMSTSGRAGAGPKAAFPLPLPNTAGSQGGRISWPSLIVIPSLKYSSLRGPGHN